MNNSFHSLEMIGLNNHSRRSNYHDNNISILHCTVPFDFSGQHHWFVKNIQFEFPSLPKNITNTGTICDSSSHSRNKQCNTNIIIEDSTINNLVINNFNGTS
jgi:hypothetical protein